MKNRTEEQIITQAPITVKLGDQEYQLKPLRLQKQWAWRKQFLDLLDTIFTTKKMESEDVVAVLKTGVGGLLRQYPEKVIDLIFSFAPDLPKDKIMEEATEEQLLLCFNEIYALAVLPIVAQAVAMKAAAAVLSQ